MKPFVLIILAALFITGCKCNNEEPGPQEPTLVIPDTLLVYEVDAEKKTLKEYTEVPDSAFTVQRVVNGLNQKYPNVRIELVRHSNDTLYINVPESEHLGERMGSTGAGAWYADAILNLTAVSGVKFVSIAMEQHSHANPGTFKREDFNDFVMVRDSIPAY